MTASIVQSTTESITLQITIPLSQSFLDTEETIQSVLNEAGTLASGEALKQFDDDGSNFGQRLIATASLLQNSYIKF